MVHYPPTRRPCTKMWKHTYFFVAIMVFMMVSQSAFAMEKDQQQQDIKCKLAIERELKQPKNDLDKAIGFFKNQENVKNDQLQFLIKEPKMQYIEALNGLKSLTRNNYACDYYYGQFENVKEGIKCLAGISLEIDLTLKGEEMDDYIIFFKTLKRSNATLTEFECKDEQFRKIRQLGLDDCNSQKIEEIIYKNLKLSTDDRESLEKMEKKVEKFLSAKNNIEYLEQIIQISIDSPSLETKPTAIAGVAIRVSKRLNKSVTPKSTVVNSKDETNNVDVTDRKCCKYFTIVSCIIIIVIVVVILFSENDEEEEAKEEDEENPNTPADIEEVSFQDLENSESIKHAIDNMNVVHKGNKVDQIASSREKIDGDGLVDVNATVEEVYVSE